METGSSAIVVDVLSDMVAVGLWHNGDKESSRGWMVSDD